MNNKMYYGSAKAAAILLAGALFISGSYTAMAADADSALAINAVSTSAAADSTDRGSIILADGDELSGGVYSASGTDESAVFADGVTASLNGVTIIKDGGDASSADKSSFEGVNAAVRAIGGADITISDAVIEASADNATAIFAYDGGTIHISDSEITATGGGAGGIQVAGGGILYAEDLTVTSSSKAAIRSDRGGGTMVVDGGTYTSLGKSGCPAIYSTADITVSNATLTAENSRAVIIEGKNSVTLENCELSGNYTTGKEGSVAANVLIYQSMSGDADEGTGSFSMTGGTLTANAGTMFYVTNTDAEIELTGTELVYSEDGGLLTVSAGRWGKDGSNGGDCVFTANDQELAGEIVVDSISSLDLILNASQYTGAINSSGTAGTVAVSLDETSTWTLTGDSYITSFEGDLSNVNTNSYTLYVNGTAVN